MFVYIVRNHCYSPLFFFSLFLSLCMWLLYMTLWSVAEIWESCSRLMLLTIWCPFVEMMLWGNFLLQGKVVVSFSCLKMIDSWLRHCEDLKWRYFILSGSCSLAYVAVADICSFLGGFFSTGSLLEFKIHYTVWTPFRFWGWHCWNSASNSISYIHNTCLVLALLSLISDPLAIRANDDIIVHWMTIKMWHKL